MEVLSGQYVPSKFTSRSFTLSGLFDEKPGAARLCMTSPDSRLPCGALDLDYDLEAVARSQTELRIWEPAIVVHIEACPKGNQHHTGRRRTLLGIR